MKKSLLFAAALFAATSGFALDENQVVYTLNGRYVVTGSENLISNGSFIPTDEKSSFDGWTVVSATADQTFDGVFSYVAADGDTPAGIISKSGANTEGIKIALPNINDASGHYVVSVTITAPEGLVPNFNFRNSNPDGLASVQLFNILGAAAENAELPEGTPQVTNSGAWQEIYPGTNTYYFGVDGDDIARSYTLEMLGFDPQLVISDIQIKEANKIADDRQVNRLMDYAKALLSIQGLDTDNDDYVGLQETLEAYAEVGDQPDQETMDGFVEALNEAIGGFQFNLVDDFLPNAADKLPLGSRKVEKLGTIGCWSGFGGGSNRLCTYVGALNEAGHYQQANSWGNGNGCIGITTTMDLLPGTYVFSMDTKAGARENNKNSWNMNAGLSFATETMYVKVAGEEGEDNAIASKTFIANPEHVEKNTISFTITEAGSYEVGVKTWAKEGYETLKYGSCLFMVDARMYGKTSAKYTKAQEDYCADVLGQINAARTNIEAAKAYIENPDYSWCKDSLKTAIALYEPITEEYEKMDSAQIISTLDRDIYVVGGSLEGLNQDGINIRQLAGEVYIAAAKGMIAAVKFFEAQNKEIEGLTNAIAAAKDTKEMRVYGMATGKADLEAAIAAAENKEAELRAAGYSEENVAAKNDAIAALNEAVAQFQASIPADCIKNLVDLTGNLSAEEAEVGYLVSGANKVGALTIENFYEDPNAGKNAEGSDIFPFSVGYILGEENAFPNLLRVGNGNATVGLDGIAEDAIVQVSFDYYYGNLNGAYAGFYVKNISKDETDTDVTNNICGLNVSKYDGKADYNPFEIDINNELTAVGASGVENENIAAESNKNSYTISIDLATKEMTCNIVSGKGSFSHTATMEESLIPTQFVVGSSYKNVGRRSFFGNLVIRTIKGGEYDGIKETVAKSINNGKIYNAAGMEVKSFVKGINIVNGKKFVK